VIVGILALLGLVVAVFLLGFRDEPGQERLWGQLVSSSPRVCRALDALAARPKAHEQAITFARRQAREAAAGGDSASAADLARAGAEFERQTQAERRRLALLRRMLSALQRR
jgi:predicted membrane chloride channel (bestrophin family)